MSAPTLQASVVARPTDGSAEAGSVLRFDCESGSFQASMFDRSPAERALISRAAGLMIDGADKISQANNPAGLAMLTEAQANVAKLSPFTVIALGSYAATSLVRIGCEQLAQPDNDRQAGFPVTARMVRGHRRLLDGALAEAKREHYAPGRPAVELHIASILAEAMLDQDRPDTVARHFNAGRIALNMLNAFEAEPAWSISAQRRLSLAENLAGSRQRVYRPGVQELRIATAKKCIDLETSSIDHLVLPENTDLAG